MLQLFRLTKTRVAQGAHGLAWAKQVRSCGELAGKTYCNPRVIEAAAGLLTLRTMNSTRRAIGGAQPPGRNGVGRH